MSTYEELEQQNYYIKTLVASEAINNTIVRLYAMTLPLQDELFYRVHKEENGTKISRSFGTLQEACEYYDSVKD